MNEKNIKLVIAEKPSVAQSIAKVIGADKREDGYLEGKDDILRGLGMCLQQAKRARVRTGALLANLRSNNN